MRFKLLEGHDDAGGPFAVIVREGEARPIWPGLRLSELGAFDHLGDLVREIEQRGLVPGRGSRTEQ
jgi:hypothetical protein